ncbi:alcohol dehydrogenase catalytic domain-containing protein [Cohnella sp. CFH 77786]|nr:alcohol dehydrogenase catalytic domain-containing protein [Cohnella sp. CFH 77786]
MKAAKVIRMNAGRQIAVAGHRKPELEGPSDVLVRILCVGLDGTDKEIITTPYGWPPEGEDELVFGHEMLGVVVDAGKQAGLRKGDLVTMIVRRPCHDPACVNCRNGRADYCQTGAYTERGIKGAHGCLTEYVKDEDRYFVKIPPACMAYGMLAEPQSILEKVWDEVQRIQQRLVWEPKRALVLGSGPLGLLAALTARCLGLDVHVWSMDDKTSPEARIVERIGGTYQQAPSPSSASGEAGREGPASLTDYVKRQQAPFDLIWECTGFSPLAFEAMSALGPNGVLALLGISSGDRKEDVPADQLNLGMVLHNKCVIGSVNAARKHFETGIYRLQQMEERYPGIFRSIVTERITLADVPNIDFGKVKIKTLVDIVPEDRWAEMAKAASEAAYSFSV